MRRISQRGIVPIIILLVFAIVAAVIVFFLRPDKQQEITEPSISGRDLATRERQKVFNAFKDAQVESIDPFAEGVTRDPRMPKSVPDEFIYPKAVVFNVEQIGNAGVAVVMMSGDSFGQVSSKIAPAVRNSGWELTAGASDFLELARGAQKAKVSLARQDSGTVISIALTY